MSYSKEDAYNDGVSDFNYSYSNECPHATGITLFDGVEERTGQTLQIVLCTYGCDSHVFIFDGNQYKSLNEALLRDSIVCCLCHNLYSGWLDSCPHCGGTS